MKTKIQELLQLETKSKRCVKIVKYQHILNCVFHFIGVVDRGAEHVFNLYILLITWISSRFFFISRNTVFQKYCFHFFFFYIVHKHLTFAPSCMGIFYISEYELTANLQMQQQISMYRVRSLLPVHSTQSFSEGWHFWEADISCARHWKLGVTHQCFHCYLQMYGNNLSVFLDNTKITEKATTTAISTVRVELDCRRNAVSFYNIKTRVLANRHQLIQTVNIPANYPVHAGFSISSGSLRLQQRCGSRSVLPFKLCFSMYQGCCCMGSPTLAQQKLGFGLGL